MHTFTKLQNQNTGVLNSLKIIKFLNSNFNLFYLKTNKRTVLIANNVQILNKEVDFLFTSEDVKKIKKFAHQKQVVSYSFV